MKKKTKLEQPIPGLGNNREKGEKWNGGDVTEKKKKEKRISGRSVSGGKGWGREKKKRKDRRALL